MIETIAEVVFSFLLACIYSLVGILLIGCCKNSTFPIQKDIKISVCMFIISFIFFEIAAIISAIYRTKIDYDAPKYDINHQMYYSSYLAFYIFNVLWVIPFNYFLATRLHTCFKDTFLEIHRKSIMILFGIYVTSVFLYFGSQIWSAILLYWLPNILVPTKKILNGLRIQYSVIVILYQFTIMVLFNFKLFKFMKSCQLNSSNSDKNRHRQSQLLNAITKQSNLMTLIISAGLINYMIQHIYFGTVLINSTHVFLMWVLAWATKGIITIFSVALIFDFNHHYYLHICKYSHFVCIKLCSYATASKHQNKSVHFKYHRVDEYITNNYSSVKCQHAAHNVLQCYQVSIICHTLLNADVENYKRKLSKVDLLNAIHHILACHDDKISFYKINQYLSNKCDNKCDIKQC
eukprot:235328_1